MVAFPDDGDPTRTRTWDPVVKSHLLYRLSYRTTCSLRRYKRLANQTSDSKHHPRHWQVEESYLNQPSITESPMRMV
jgi:hypothetical protein